jgi:hypothetical protein
MIFLPLGVVVARLARSVVTRWVRWHWLIQVCLTGPAILIAFALGVNVRRLLPLVFSSFNLADSRIPLPCLPSFRLPKRPLPPCTSPPPTVA